MRIKDFARSGHTPTLFSAFLYFDVSFMVWVMLGPLGPFIGEELGLSATQKGLMTAFPILGGSILRLVLGALADHIGAKKAGLLGLTLTMVPLLLGWFYATSFATIVVVGLLLGIAGASFAVALPLASRWYPREHQGLVMGIAGAGNSGTVLAALFAPRLAQAFGWHTVFGLALLPVAAVWLIFAITARDAPNAPKTTAFATYREVLREPDTLWFCLMYAITFGGFVGLATYLPIFFRDQYGLSKVAAGNFAAICVFAGSFVRPVGGYFADRLGGIRVLLVLYGLIGLLAAAVSMILPLAGETLLLFMIMALLGSGNGAVFQLAPLRWSRQLGVMTGIIGAAGGLGGFALPTLLGLLKDRTGAAGAGFLVFALASFAGGILLLRVRRRWQAVWASQHGRVADDMAQSLAPPLVSGNI